MSIFDGPYAYTNPPISIAALRFSGAVEFGSRALGVASKYSDYDFAILRANFNNLFENNMPDEFPIKNYFRVIPPKGNNTLAHKVKTDDNNYVDLLVLEHQEHLDMLKNAINSIKYNPKYSPWMYDKVKRIRIFEDALSDAGFITRWPVRLSNWILKTF